MEQNHIYFKSSNVHTRHRILTHFGSPRERSRSVCWKKRKKFFWKTKTGRWVWRTKSPTQLRALPWMKISFPTRTLKKLWESWKDWPPLRGLPHGLLRGLPCGLLPRTTLNNQPNLLLRGKRHKPTYSTGSIKTVAIRLPRPSLFFHIRPILHRPSV